MTFHSWDFDNFVATTSSAQRRLFPQYRGHRNDFDVVVVGSGMGGGILADELVDAWGDTKRVLVLEAGSFLFPTHVYNVCRFPNGAVARQFASKTFWQYGQEDSQYYLHERPQLCFGGRSIFWSGLIPSIQPWELDFFPERVRNELADEYLAASGAKMNESVSLGRTARALVARLRQTSLAEDFDVRETPRAVHQPYLTREGTIVDDPVLEPTGVFNTAELLLNQVGLVPGTYHGDHGGLHLLLNQYVEDVRRAPHDRFEILARDTVSGAGRVFDAQTLVLAGGSIESPKLLRRSSLFSSLPDDVKPLVGRGLTDHPTTDEVHAYVTHLADVPLSRDSHAKIVFYSKGRRDASGAVRFPFNVEMNVNHEYWHLRENDPSSLRPMSTRDEESRVDLKFSFGNCLDDGNQVQPALPYAYVPEITFKNLHWLDHLADDRFPKLAGWHKSYEEIFAVLNDVAGRIFSEFSYRGTPCRPSGTYGRDGCDFGLGTVHHAAGTLRMPHRTHHDGPFSPTSVVDEDLRVRSTRHLYVCDMSVMPFSSAANPVRTLGALALRLARHFTAA